MRKKKIFAIVVFIFGFFIMIYPFISQQFYKIKANEEVRQFDKKVSELDKGKILKKFNQAKAYNSTLKPSDLSDPYTKSQKEEGVKAYANMLKIQEKIGYIDIPKIDVKIPIYAGTSEDILSKGAGHLEGTSLPVGGENTHTVITAHRGLPTARLFTDLDKINKKDKFYIHVLDKVLAYEVDQILTVEPTNFDPVLVTKNKDYATLLTCTPYMINSHRLLVRGHRIDYTAPIDDGIMKDRSVFYSYQFYLLISLIILAILLIIAYKYYSDLRKIKNN